MKVAIFSTHPTWVTHLETELEIAQELLNEGVEVDFYICNDSRFNCCENILSRSLLDKIDYYEIADSNCDFCINRQSRGFELLNGFVNKYPLINEKQRNIKYTFDDSYLDSSAKLKTLYYDDNYDIGWSLLSSLISFTRNPFVNVFEYKDIIKSLYSDSIKVYETAKEAIILNGYDRIYIFNGRFSYTKGLYNLGLKLKLSTYIHERGSVPDKYELYINSTPHNISDFHLSVNNYWLKGNFFSRKRIGKEFYNKKIKGFGGSWESFTTNFVENKLPPDFNNEIFNIVLYTSSEDEFTAIDDTYFYLFFKTQLEGIEYLCNELSGLKDSKIHLYIRIHPNSRAINHDYLEKLLSFSLYSNVTVIPPDSDVNSYSLLFNASKVITFGSTITIEAVFWKIPVVLLSNCQYTNFRGPMIPSEFEQVKEMCLEKSHLKSSNKDAIKLGYYFNTYGLKYKNYKAIDYLNGYFKGVNLSTGELLISPEPKFTTFVNRIKRILYPCYLLFKKVI
jgi:hypothetical protein